MEFVEGRPLAHFLKTWGRFSEQNAIVIARQALTALAVAHAAGIVHRDIKPDNLILAKKGVLKLVDLGLAKKVDDPGASSTGFAAGTPYYISPEQIEGRSDVDGRADLYSLGATLFQLVTGQVPFPGPSSAVIMSRHLNERPPDPRDLTPELSEGFSYAVLRLMTRERERRPRERRRRPSAPSPPLQAAGAAPRCATTPAPAASPDPASSAFETAVSNAPAGPAASPPRSAPATTSPTPSRAPGTFPASVRRRLARRLGRRRLPPRGGEARRAGRSARPGSSSATRRRRPSDFEDLCRRLAEQIPDEARDRRSSGTSSRAPPPPALPVPAAGRGAGRPSRVAPPGSPARRAPRSRPPPRSRRLLLGRGRADGSRPRSARWPGSS